MDANPDILLGEEGNGDEPSLRESPAPSAVIKRLSKVQRKYVADGCIHGDCTMTTVRVLMSKGLFHLVIDSPNGRYGFMRLTPLGEAVRAALTALPSNRKDGSSPLNNEVSQ